MGKQRAKPILFYLVGKFSGKRKLENMNIMLALLQKLLRDKLTGLLVLLPVLFDGPVEDLDEVVDVLATPDGIPDKLERVGD